MAKKKEPIEGYDSLSPGQIVTQLPELDDETLENIKEREESSDRPRAELIAQADLALFSGAEGDDPNAEIGAAEQEAFESEEKDEKPEEPGKGEPFGKGSVRQQAEKSQHDPDEDDPTDPHYNESYIEDRDPVEAARNQESPTSSNPDDFGQRLQAALGASEDLRREVAESQEELPETSPQHAVSSAAAERGEPYPPPSPSTDDLLDVRQEETEKAEKENAKAAKKQAKDLKGDDAVVAQARESAPPELDLLEGEPDGSRPNDTPLQVGYRVSRRDRAHDEVGVIVNRHEPQTGGLVDVQFPNAGVQTLNTLNLTFEGDPISDQASQEAYASSENRGF